MEHLAILGIGIVFILMFGVFYVSDTLSGQVLALASASSPGGIQLPRDILVATMFLFGEFFVTIIALFTIPQLITRDVQQKTLPLFLSKPIPRWKYFTGKFIGGTATLCISFCILAGIIFLFVVVQSFTLLTAVLLSTFFVLLKLTLLSALLMSLALRFPEWLGAIIALTYYVGGHVNFYFSEWSTIYPGIWGEMMKTAYYILPDLLPISSRSIISAAVENYPLDINYVYWFFKQIGIYVFGFLFLGYAAFKKKPL